VAKIDRGLVHRSSSGALRRALGFLAFLPVASRAPIYTRLMWELIRDERTPASRKALLAGALGYLLLGRDVIPDDIPVLGGLDDLVVVIVAVDLFLDGVPAEVLHEKLQALGIDRSAFEQDVAQIRRLTPGPVRRVVRRAPQALGVVDRAIKSSGLAPRIRSYISKEGPSISKEDPGISKEGSSA
jgi:uncharacterized membrane protein YkvA (DUF1232 family)